MCGLIALCSTGDRAPIPFATAALRTVLHRGPDDEGLVAFVGERLSPIESGKKVGVRLAATGCESSGTQSDDRDLAIRVVLGHRRLSIIDLSSTGHQPMCTRDRACWIVYNGEIYNYLELREELRALGHAFETESDTEVILAAYRQWGAACLSRFNGMFAFVLFDRGRDTLFAARDRFGVKPLYYWVSPEGLLAFASEIKQFTVLPGWRPRVNGQRAYDFLNWALLDHTDETLFEGVFQLRGGEMVELELAKLSEIPPAPGARLPVRRWYELRPQDFAGTFADAARRFRELLADSIRLRLRADVPVGSCLSGGLDSSSIVCVLNELLRERGADALQETFSACAEVARFDESRFIEAVTRHASVASHRVFPDADGLFASLDRITWHQDEPFGSTSIYAQWRVFELAAQHHVKVMLDGQGADELLAGYHNYFGAHYGALLRSLRWLSLWREMRAAARLHRYSATWALKQTLNNILPELVRQPLRRLAGKPGANVSWIHLDRLGADPRDPYLDHGAAKAPSVQAMSRAQILHTSLPMLLHWEDRDSMAHSVEARLPFLDYRLVEFVLGLPDNFKIRNGTTKRLLREALRGTLPETVRQRMDKMGFVTPEEVWLRETHPERFRAALRQAVEASRGILDRRIEDMLERTIAGRRPFDVSIWRAISFGNWMKVFDVRL
jgi:asparagine synthase (glutamine-hydrolysing)